MATIGRLIVKIGANIDDLENDLKKGQGLVSKFGGKLASLGKGVAKAGLAAAGAGLLTVATAAGTATAAGLSFADEVNAAMDEVAGQTTLTAEAMDSLKESALNVFGANFGGSITDVATVMGEANKQTKLIGDELEGVTTAALVMRDRFKQDVAGSINAIDVLMEEFGMTSQQATDFLFLGLQKGLDSSGDFLDTVREYSNLFSQGGIRADEFFSILETGLAGGVLGTDKVADLFKEFTLRVGEGGDEVSEAFAVIGLDFERIQGFIRSGDESWGDYFDTVIEGLANTEDPILRQQIGLTLMGTQFEDLGAKAVLSISETTTSLEDMTGATNDAVQSNKSLGSTVQELGRNFLTNIEPAAQELIPLLASGLEMAGDFMNEAAPVFKDFAVDLKGNLGPAMAIIENSLVRIGKALGIATDETDGMDIALGFLKTSLDLVVTGVQAVAVVTDQLARAFEIASGLVDQIRFISSQNVGDILGATARSLGFATGGIVPGQRGRPVLAVVHGGEEINPPGQRKIDNRQFTDNRQFILNNNNFGSGQRGSGLDLSTLGVFS